MDRAYVYLYVVFMYVCCWPLSSTCELSWWRDVYFPLLRNTLLWSIFLQSPISLPYSKVSKNLVGIYWKISLIYKHRASCLSVFSAQTVWQCVAHISNNLSKVKILWEGHKIWKDFHLFWRLLSNVKTSRRFFFQIFVTFSENLKSSVPNVWVLPRAWDLHLGRFASLLCCQNEFIISWLV